MLFQILLNAVWIDHVYLQMRLNLALFRYSLSKPFLTFRLSILKSPADMHTAKPD